MLLLDVVLLVDGGVRELLQKAKLVLELHVQLTQLGDLLLQDLCVDGGWLAY